MSATVRWVGGEAFMSYKLSEDPPLQPIRVKLAVELMRELGLVEFAKLVPPRVADDAELALCHAKDYVDLVRTLSEPGLRDGVDWAEIAAGGFAIPDNPSADGMHEDCATVVGVSLGAAEAVHSGVALDSCSPAGGLHHASR